jgi:hypothetical protein
VQFALATMSENTPLTPQQEADLLTRGPAFIRAGNIGFVVIDRDRASNELAGMAIKAFRLRHVETNGALSLYVPESMPQPANGSSR